MFKYFVSENMKTKGTFVQKLTFIAPIMVILLSVFLTATYFQVDIYNWWYTLILAGTISLSSSLLYKLDGSMKNKGVIGLPLDLKKVWIAKILVGVKNIAISCGIIFLAGELGVLVININSVSNISFLSGFIGTLVIIVTSIWQIPLYFFLCKKIGMVLTVILSIIFSISATDISPGEHWIIYPFSYTSRLMCPILKILPNGLLAKCGSKTFSYELLNTSAIPKGIIISIVLFIVFTYLTAKSYEGQEVK